MKNKICIEKKLAYVLVLLIFLIVVLLSFKKTNLGNSNKAAETNNKIISLYKTPTVTPTPTPNLKEILQYWTSNSVEVYCDKVSLVNNGKSSGQTRPVFGPVLNIPLDNYYDSITSFIKTIHPKEDFHKIIILKKIAFTDDDGDNKNDYQGATAISSYSEPFGVLLPKTYNGAFGKDKTNLACFNSFKSSFNTKITLVRDNNNNGEIEAYINFFYLDKNTSDKLTNIIYINPLALKNNLIRTNKLLFNEYYATCYRCLDKPLPKDLNNCKKADYMKFTLTDWHSAWQVWATNVLKDPLTTCSQ